MASFLKKIFGKEGIEHTEKSTSQPLPTKLILESLNDNEVEYIKKQHRTGRRTIERPWN